MPKILTNYVSKYKDTWHRHPNIEMISQIKMNYITKVHKI